jgi:hypothetical protein
MMNTWYNADINPPPNGPLLTYCGDSYAGYHIEVLINHDGSWSRASGAAIEFHGRITHWMPLPEQPSK